MAVNPLFKRTLRAAVATGSQMRGDSPRPTTRSEAVRLISNPEFVAVMSIAATLPTSVAIVAPALPGMATALGVADARIGLVVTAITLPPMLLAPVIGIGSDMLGRRTVALPALFLYGTAGVAIAFTDSFPLILALRGCQGVAMAGIAPLTVTLLGDLYTGSLRTTAQGIRSSTGGLALAVIPILAGALAGIAWHYPFYLYAFALVAMVAVHRYVPETAKKIHPDQGLHDSLREYTRSIAAEIRNSRLLVVMGGGFVRFFSLFGFLTFVPIFAVRSLGASPFEAGVVVAVSGIRILLSPTAGFWVSRFSRQTTILGTLTIQFVVFALLPFAPTIWWLGGLAVLFGVGDATLDPVVNDAVTGMVSAQNRNGVVGGLRVLKEAGKTVAPVVLGAILALGGYGLVFWTMTVVVVSYGIVVYVVLHRY